MYGSAYYLPRSYHAFGKHTYREIGGPDGYLARCATFAGHSMFGGLERDPDGRRVFRVYSYGTLIATYDLDSGERAVETRKISATTTRHENLCAAWLAAAIERPAARPAAA